jgi:hypothetical protein
VKKRRLKFALAAVALAVAVPSTALLAVDVYLHGKYAKTAGFNIWGYRGPHAGRKTSDEYRVVVLGGSAAFGYGTNWDEAIPAALERHLAGRTVSPYRRFRVINLAYNAEGAYSFRFTLDDYRWLKYDLAVLYEGYNDLMGDPRRPNLAVFRHDSPVFRLTGYMPIFHMVFREKAAVMTGNSIRSVYWPCRAPWQEYCRSVRVAIDFALQHNAQVLVATQPWGVGVAYRARHQDQQGEMAAMIARRYGGNPRVLYANLGEAVNLGDPMMSYDSMHLTAAGNDRMAAAFVQPVLEMAARRASGHR